MAEVDDYVRWLGKQRPVGLAWIGLAILEVACAFYIATKAYIDLNEYLGQDISVKEIVKYIDNAGVIQR